jgi:DNA-binding transcriptional MerR regulator
MEDLKQLANTHPYWSLDEFAHVANQWLPRCLPEARANTRVREDVNPRLIRQYTTWGLVDAPLKEGREARYTYRHLLQLLVTRRLLADGYATAVIHKLVAGQGDDGLEEMLAGGAMSAAAEASVNPAIAFLQGLTGRTQRAAKDTRGSESHSDSLKRRDESRPSPAASSVRSAAPSLKKMAAPRRPAAAPTPDYEDEFSDADEVLAVDMAFYEREDIASTLEAAPAPRPAMSPPPAPAPAPAPFPRRWTRLDVAPGLELNVREDYRFPASPAERQALLSLIAELLDTPPDDA